MVLIDGEALAQRGDGHCIGGTQGRTQGKRCSKRNGRHKRMREEAHDKHDEQDESQCQRQHGPALTPQRLLVRLDGVPVEQGRNEEDKEEVWIERDGDRSRAHGKRDTEHDLHERGRCLRENLGHNTRHEDGGKHENDGQDGLHMCSNLLVRPGAATSAALKTELLRQSALRATLPQQLCRLLAINQNAPRENLAGGIRKNYQSRTANPHITAVARKRCGKAPEGDVYWTYMSLRGTRPQRFRGLVSTCRPGRLGPQPPRWRPRWWCPWGCRSPWPR